MLLCRSHLRQGGFTLVEMLVAMVLVSLIGVIMVEGLRVGQRAYAQVVRIDTEANEIFVVQRFLRRVLESAQPPPGSPTALSATSFVGTSNRVVLTAPAVNAAGADLLNRYEIMLKSAAETGKRWNLVVRVQNDRSRLSSQMPAPFREEVLIKDVSSVEWSYLEYGDPADASSSAPRWLDRWTDDVRLPALVRLKVSFPEGTGRRWPVFSATPRVTHPAGCAFDMVAQDCRPSS